MSWINVTAAGANALACAVFNPLKIVAVDVGQGNATLILAPNGKNYLVDSGYTENTNTGESNSQAIMNILRDEGREQVIHGIVVSHYDRDHMEGFIDCSDNPLLPTELVIDKYNVSNWGSFTSYADCRDSYVDLLPEGENSGHIQIGENGEGLGTAIDLGGDWQMIIVAGGGYVWAGDDNVEAIENADSENEQSLVVLITKPEDVLSFSAIVMGDATGPAYGAEDADVESAVAGSLKEIFGFDYILSVLFAGHHGASNATGANFIEMLGFIIAYISVGEQNYDHPTQNTVDTLNESPSVNYILQTNCGDPSDDNQTCNDPESDKKMIVGSTIIRVKANGRDFSISSVDNDIPENYVDRPYINCDDGDCVVAQ